MVINQPSCLALSLPLSSRGSSCGKIKFCCVEIDFNVSENNPNTFLAISGKGSLSSKVTALRTLAAFHSTGSQEIVYMRYRGSGGAGVADPSFLCCDVVSPGKQTLLGKKLPFSQRNSSEDLNI